MSDGGISGQGAIGTGAPHHEGRADAASYAATPEPGPSENGGLTEDQAREVLTGLVDEHLSRHDGLERISARMEEFAQQQRQWADSLAQQGFLADEYGDSDEPYEPDVLDELDQVLTDAVDRRLDAAEDAEEAELLLATRDLDYDDLRERMPMLQNDQTAAAVLDRAVALIHEWGAPELISSPEFVQVIEQVALASYAAPSLLQQRQSAAAPRGNGNGNPGLYAQGHVHLEAAQGASARELSNPGTDWGARIVKAAERLRPRI